MKRTILVLIPACLAVACQESSPPPALPPVAAPAAPSDTPQLPPGHPPLGNGFMGGGHGDLMMGAPQAPPHSALKWTDPAAWTKEPPASEMRKAQYRITKAGKDTEDAELVVYYFGAGQGGDVNSNVSRWTGQFTGPDGAPSKSSKTETRTVGTLPVTVVSVDGTYDGGMTMSGTPAGGSKAGWALLGAIVETPGGPWFFKMTGPKDTVSSAKAAFDSLVGSFHVE